jgi:hypothetical protein
MNRVVKIVLLASTLILLQGASFVARACSCADEPYPPCRDYWKASAIFSGLATNISLFIPPGRSESEADMLVVRFRVEKSYKGEAGEEVEVLTPRSNLGCGYPFQVGERYLVYAHKASDKLMSTSCSATKLLDKAFEDIGYFQTLGSAPKGGSISGRVGKWNKDFQKGTNTISWLPGIKVIAEGVGPTIYSVTDAEGNFQMKVSQAGQYRVRALYPASLEESYTVELDINNGQCGYARLESRSSGSISGHVLTREGQPVRKGQLYISSADYVYKNGFSVYKAWFTELDESGGYKFEAVPPGRYLIVVNPYAGPPRKWDSPYPQTYYPGVPDLQQAAVITLGEAVQLENIDLRMSEPIRQRTITGTVERPDGRPAQGIKVYLENREAGGYMDSVVTDEAGRFTLNCYEGFVYEVQAEITERPERRSQRVQLPPRGRIAPLKLILGLNKQP